ncbi:MAG: ATP-binding protein [Bacteroidales bacterium]|nr:ATP-binding protein [Bacteroidales bacterium]
MIPRKLHNLVKDRLYKGKAVIILGPRQTGKTTLLRQIEEESGKRCINLNCDQNDIRKLLTEPNVSELKRVISGNEIVMIDEAQRVMNIGLTLKLITDQISEVQMIVTGSSSLDLSNMINEPLTGRKFEYQLFPVSFAEMSDHFGYLETRRRLDNLLIFGMYPDVINNPGNEPEILKNLVSSYLYKDVFNFQDIRKPEFIDKLLGALAFQVASEVSFNELARLLGTDPHTIERYINLLEKAFIIFRLRSFSRNARNELRKSRKIYFFDNGVRNAVMGNFTPLEGRTDSGRLWENWIISERMKHLHYNRIYAGTYFWRTTQQQEIDYIEETDGHITAFEIKMNPSKVVRFPMTFTRNYPTAECKIVNYDTFPEFLGL